jgi:hypothetical protein
LSLSAHVAFAVYIADVHVLDASGKSAGSSALVQFAATPSQYSSGSSSPIKLPD